MKKTLAIALCICTGISAAVAQKLSTDRLVNVRHFLQLVYPELDWSKKDLCIEDRNARSDEWMLHEFSVVAIKGYCFPRPEYEKPVRSEDILYRAGFSYSKDGRMVAFGSSAYQAENDRMRSEIEAHQEWTDDELKAALKAAGFRYAPDDEKEFLKSISLERLQQYTGPFELDRVTFFFRQRYTEPDGKETKYSNGLDLYVDGTCALPNGTKSHCWFVFEPYRGRLIRFGY
jgi:hypothetical protein